MARDPDKIYHLESGEVYKGEIDSATMLVIERYRTLDGRILDNVVLMSDDADTQVEP